MQFLSLFLTILSFVLIGVMIFTFRKVRTVSTKSPLISMVMSLVALLIYTAMVGTSLSAGILFLIILAGFTLGAWQGRNTKVWIENGKSKAQNTIWFLVVWGMCYGFNQILVSLGQAMSLSVGIGAMSLGTGVTLGSQGLMLFKLLRVSTKVPVKCPKCGHMVAPGRKFCTKCGQPLD